MKLKWIALISGLLPIIAVNAAYILAASNGHVPTCLPYLEGCSSISAAGRQPPESLLFRAAMIPAAVFIMAYWWLNHAWLMAAGAGRSWGNTAMLWLGTTACLFLVLYSVALGHIGPEYALQRRIGVTLYFAFTFLAQLILLNAYKRLQLQGKLKDLTRIFRIKLFLCSLMLALGVTQPVLNALYPQHPDLEDIIEWNFALLMHLYFIVTYFVWRVSAFTTSFSVNQAKTE